MTPQQMLDWAFEPRLPHHLPLWVWRKLHYSACDPGPPTLSSSIPVILTWDVEHDLGSKGQPDEWSACPPFLAWLAETSAVHGWRTTLFVQGSIVEPLADLLKPLVPQHEVGVHGHFHEMWGRQLWFLDQPGVTRERRRALLAEALAAFERAGLPQPRSFRAPYLVCDAFTLDLLDEHGFLLDSSASAYRGCEPVVTRRKRLIRVPISGSPRPRIRRRWGIPTWAPYDHLDLTTFLFTPPEKLLRLIGEILAVQDQIGTPRHLVLLAHTWDFADVPFPGCSSANFQRYVDRVDLVAQHLPLHFTTLSGLVGREAASMPQHVTPIGG